MRPQGRFRKIWVPPLMCGALLSPEAFGADLFGKEYLNQGRLSPMDRQLYHLSDENGNRLAGWSEPKRHFVPRNNRSQKTELQRIQENSRLLNTVRFPQVEFDNTPLRDAVTWLKQGIYAQVEPGQERPFVMLKLGEGAPDAPKVTLSLTDVTAQQVLDKISKSLGLEIVISDTAIALHSK